MNKKEIKKNYIIIPFIVLMVMLSGRYFTSAGMPWYNTLAKPALTPPGYLFGVVWAILYTSIALVALFVWNKAIRNKEFEDIKKIMIYNLVFNAAWTFLFFYLQQMHIALIDITLLNITNFWLVYLIAKNSKAVASALVPYTLWCMFALYLNAHIIMLNN